MHDESQLVGWDQDSRTVGCKPRKIESASTTVLPDSARIHHTHDRRAITR